MSDMYEEVTGNNVNPFAGKCPIDCAYCYVQLKLSKWPNTKEKYSGPVRLVHSELRKNYNDGKTRFLCSCIDLFAPGIPPIDTQEVIDWAEKQKTTWIIQTKNPRHPIFQRLIKSRPENFKLGVTIESNLRFPEIMPNSHPKDRVFKGLDFVTIEPVMDFVPSELIRMITQMAPKWVWIGANSAHDKIQLLEPSADTISFLIKSLEAAGIEVRRKPNLKRLLGQEADV